MKRKLVNVLMGLLVAVFLVAQTKAQNQPNEAVLKQFENYRQTTIQEKIYLHTDKTFYLAGELCWFKIYNVDAVVHKPLDFSKLAYVEILDRDNRSVLQTKVALKNGDGNGSLQLPFTLISGRYKLRAYTNWMKNFSADYFFEKTLTIVNSRKPAEDTIIQTKKKYDLQFFPEGGNLVNKVESKVAVRMVDKNGKGINTSGVIINAANDTILRFKTEKFGIGHFILKPEPSQTYRALVAIPHEETVSVQLPEAYKNGYVMQLANHDAEQLKVTVKIAGNDFDFNPVYLFAHTRNSIKLALAGKLQNGTLVFLIAKDKLGEGITHFTLFDTDNHPVCERLYFKYPEKQLQVKMTTDSAGYGIRNKVNVNISITDSNGDPKKSKMSMAVYLTDSLQPKDEMDIGNYLWLTSDLTGTIESPQYYFSNNTPEVREAMDNLMLTHGWRRFKWHEIQEGNKPVLKFLPEYNGHIVTGRVVKTGLNLPGKDIPVYFSVAGKRLQLHTALSDTNGKIMFNVKDFYNEGEIIVQSNSQKDSLYSVEIDNPFFPGYANRPLPIFSLQQVKKPELEKRHAALQIQTIYHNQKFNQFNTLIDSSAFFFKPDITYLLDNYVRFTTMEEVMIEYVREVKVKKTKGNYRFAVYNINQQLFFEEDPLLLLNGVPVFNGNKLMSYNPLNIEKLEVIERMYHFENMLFSGIVNMVTYDGNLSEYELDPNVTIMDYEGLQLQRQFFSPVYESKEQYETRLPDCRNVLYWTPDVSIDETGKKEISFYCSDLPGNYVIVLQGLSENGKTGTQTLLFQVRK